MTRNIVPGTLLTMMLALLSACAAQKQSAQTAPSSVPDSAIAAPDPVAEQVRDIEARPDPLEPFNQAMLTFNRKADDWVLHPVAGGYADVVPQPARQSVGRFFANVTVIPRFANNLFQGRFRQAGVEAERFGINTTLGIFGLFDPAEKYFGLEPHPNDFGLTLAKYGVDEGPYLVLPLFGPSTLRDAVGKVADGAMNPVNYVAPSGAALYEAAAKAVEAINARSENLDTFEDVDRYSVDLYGAVQDAYFQHRVRQENRIRSGQ